MARWCPLSESLEDDRGDRRKPMSLDVPDKLSFRFGGRSFRPAGITDTADPAERATLLGRLLLRQEASRSGWARAILTTLCAICIAVMGVLAAVVYVQGEPILATVAFLFFPTVMILASRSDRRMTMRLRERLAALPPACLVCGYDLSGLAPDPDGCTVCPECSAAWQLDAAAPNDRR